MGATEHLHGTRAQKSSNHDKKELQSRTQGLAAQILWAERVVSGQSAILGTRLLQMGATERWHGNKARKS
eukprot:2523693-Rhodomonas_salina.1